MRAAIEVVAKAEDAWEFILKMTGAPDERLFIVGYLSGRSFSEGVPHREV